MIFYRPVTQNEPIFFVSTSLNSTQITKLILNNNTSNVYILFSMTSRIRKKRKNFKINRKGGILKNSLNTEDIPLYRKTWQVSERRGRSSFSLYVLASRISVLYDLYHYLLPSNSTEYSQTYTDPNPPGDNAIARAHLGNCQIKLQIGVLKFSILKLE